MKTILNWIIWSSKDPTKRSLFVKGLLLSMIPVILQTLGWVCVIGQICLDVDYSVLETFAEAIAQLVYYITSAISAWAIVWGLWRKIMRTLQGKNSVLK